MTHKTYNTEEQALGKVCESQHKWGGDWTVEKLDALEKYVRAYLTIMKRYAPKYGWQLFYFDAFAGSGTTGKETQQPSVSASTSIFLDELADTDWAGMEKEETYKGAAERVVGLDIDGFGFDYYYFVDKDTKSLTKLETMLKGQFPLRSRKMVFKTGDANKKVLELVEYAKTHPKCSALVLLDPFGMQLDWSTIEALQAIKHLDLWILVPSGVIINRLLKRDGEIMYPENLTRFFGMSENELKSYFYEREVEQTLFGNDVRIRKAKNAIERIAQLYVDRLKTLFECVTEKPLVLRNSTKCSIFHFVFASHNETGLKIASQIVGKKNKR
ncbi:three-Cys-motif partner protein TcmP [Prevotella intermedia]|uniref:Three-Cys-motif partner protein TcmP n=3 Tax=Prevotella intermedia TaxID=28131 RepID=A0A425VRQ7_PREIN|nr:three-Cys-motif partner protein TcmP [Prevotella intermedia]RRF88259.1 three-Cys-motif partner protein TcmP [Prevotella intermedia]